VTDQENFDRNSTGGVADSKAMESNEGYLPVQEAGLDASAMSKIYTDVLDKGGYDVSKLQGDAISVSNGADKANNPNEAINIATSGSGNPEFNVTVNQQSVSVKQELTTVENIRSSLGDHEMVGHGEINVGPHHKVYEFQFKETNFQGTTDTFKKNMEIRYEQYLKREDPAKYKLIMGRN
jgi:hypothetical protein